MQAPLPAAHCGNAGSHAIPSPAPRPPVGPEMVAAFGCLLFNKACPEWASHPLYVCKGIHTPTRMKARHPLSPASRHHRHHLCCPCAPFPTLLDCAQPQISRGYKSRPYSSPRLENIFWWHTTSQNRSSRSVKGHATTASKHLGPDISRPTSVATSEPTTAHSLE